MALLATALRALAHAGFAACIAALLLAVAQPIFTDDTWWHLALGAAYARQGPRLAGDPLLFTATSAPPPMSWLADLLLHGVYAAGGFQALRLAHTGLVAAILALVWQAARQAGRSALAGSAAAAGFAAISAYHLVQLRPELLSIAAALWLHRALLARPGLPSWPRVLACAGGIGLWANLHPGFALGLLFLAAASAGLLLALPLRAHAARRADRARAGRLALALALGGLATLVNPAGPELWRTLLSAGSDMLAQGLVADEWRPTHLLQWPVSNLPPSALSWAGVWALLVAAPWAALRSFRSWRREDLDPQDGDPALLGLALASLAAMIAASRFLWLGVFPLCFALGAAHRSPGTARGICGHALLAATALALTPGFLRFGDWPMLSKGIPTTLSGWAEPYPAAKYDAHAVWLLRDAGLEGNLYGGYSAGGFLGFWLAPELRCAWNGSLNLPGQALRANLALRERSGTPEQPDFLALLDAQGIDLFLGTGFPFAARAQRPAAYTTTHLEGAPGWLPIFRNLHSALYLRRHERNAVNLRRIADYYSARGVPFDPERGFEQSAVIDRARTWAVEHGLVPRDFDRLVAALAPGSPPPQRASHLDALATIELVLGLYRESLAADAALLELEPSHVPALRRRVFCLLHLGAPEGLAPLPAALSRLVRARGGDPLDAALASAARLALERGELPPRELAALPGLTRDAEAVLATGVVQPQARTRRARP